MLDRSVAPPFVKSTSFSLPKTSQFSLPNGIKVVQLQEIQQEIVKIEIVYPAGKWFETKPELAHFTSHMLDKGTKSMTSADIAEIFDLHGAHIEISSNLDYVSISLYSLSRHLKKIFPSFLELITEPSFPADELLILKNQFIQSLRIRNEKTSYVASKLIRSNVFGAAHPYGHSTEESEVSKIEVNNLNDYFKTQFQPSHIFILGALSKADETQLITSFSQFTKADSRQLSYPTNERFPKSELVEKDESVQSSIRIGKRSLQRQHTDYPALVLLNYYLGGFFGSRLMKNLREDRGLTYGISSSINPFRNDSILLVGTDVNKENRDVAVAEILNEIKLLKSHIIEDELELAKRHFIGSLQSETASPFSVIGKIKTIELNGLSYDYYQHLVTAIDKTTSSELYPIAAKYMNENDFQQVVVG